MVYELIAAIGKNNELGKDGELLWDLPEDMKLFRKYTKNKFVIMGKNTYESIGKALPSRHNIIISKSLYERKEDIEFHNVFTKLELFPSIKAFMEVYDGITGCAVFIGGSRIYEEGLPYCRRLYISHVDGEYPDADTYFPEYDFSKNDIIEEDKHEGFTFRIYNGNRG